MKTDQHYSYLSEENQNQCHYTSGSHDSTIKIWKQNKTIGWQVNQTLEDHENFINCMIVNNQKDIIISGGQDQIIKIWRKLQILLECAQTIKEHSSSVLNVSLNQLDNKLITIEQCRTILVIEQKERKEWVDVQKICVQFGVQLCFFSNNKFAQFLLMGVLCQFMSLLILNSQERMFYKFLQLMDVLLVFHYKIFHQIKFQQPDMVMSPQYQNLINMKNSRFSNRFNNNHLVCMVQQARIETFLYYSNQIQVH